MVLSDGIARMPDSMRHRRLVYLHTAKCDRHARRDCDQQRPERDAKHPASATVDETCRGNEQADRNTHPPRCEETDHRSANALWKRRINKTKLPELEFCEILGRDRVTDLVVHDAVETGGYDGENHDENKDAELFKGAHDTAQRKSATGTTG